MAIDAQVNALTKRHEELDAAIVAETKNPAFDEFEVIAMKRQKLRIKDKLQKLRKTDC